jgi:glucose/arabinose dehydrogenase
MSKMTATRIRIIGVLLLVIITGSGILVYQNGRNSDISEREQQTEISIESSQPIEPNTAQTRIPQSLSVPEEFKKGVFATNRQLVLPKEYGISVFAAGMKGVRFMTIGDQDALYVTDIDAGKVYILKDFDRNLVADEIIEVDSGLKKPHGIDYFNGDLFVGEEHQIIVYRSIRSDGTFVKKEVIIQGLPSGSGHSTRTVVIGPDEKLYVSIGSSCNVCEENDSRRASIMRYNMDGTGEEKVASGLRNTVGFIFDDNKIWSVDNGRDRIGDNIPSEEVNLIETGKDYGWPYCYGRGIPNPEFREKNMFCTEQTAFPVHEMQAHSAPLGLALSPDQNQWRTYKKNLFIAFHGSWNRTVPTGFKIVTINTTQTNAGEQDFISGWLNEDGTHWGRPVDVIFDVRGNLYISDDQNGAVYIVQRIAE